VNRALFVTLVAFAAVLTVGAAIAIPLAGGGSDRQGGCVVEVNFRMSASQAQIAAVRARLERDPSVASFEFRSKEAALEEMRERFPELVEELEYNPLPDSFQVELRREEDDRALMSEFSQASGVQSVQTCPTRRAVPRILPPTKRAPCRGVPRPISASTVARVLRTGGFSMERVNVTWPCKAPIPNGDQMAELSNEDAGPSIDETEGDVACSIYRGPIFQDRLRRNLHEPPASPIFVGRKARWWFRNVECRMYAGEQHPDEQVAKLDAVMERLARVTSGE
jgi:hypothetical protein